MAEKVASAVAMGTGDANAELAARKASSVTGGGEMQTGKRVVKLTVKALAAKLESLQNERKSKLNKASVIRKTIKDLMMNNDKTEVQNALDELTRVCKEAKFWHDSVLALLHGEEKVKHETWFKAMMLNNDDSIVNAKKWVLDHDGFTAHGNSDVVDDINPNDSISNVGSKRPSQRSHRSGRSSTTSARIKAEADRAALLARQAALKAKHALEEQQEQLKRKMEEQELQLRRKMEELDLEAELAAFNAKLAVLETCGTSSIPSEDSNGMNSYFEREKGKVEHMTALNPMAKEFCMDASTTKSPARIVITP